MSTTSYEDKRCEHSNEGGTFTLYVSNVAEVSNPFEKGELGSGFVLLPDWLADAIREAFIRKIEQERDKSA